MQTLNEIKQQIIKRGGETNALVVIERVRRAAIENCKTIMAAYKDRQRAVGPSVDLYSAQLAAEVSAFASFANVEKEVYGHGPAKKADVPDGTLGIYRKCKCGFRTWFDSEENEHLEETKDDVHEHKFLPVIVERESDA